MESPRSTCLLCRAPFLSVRADTGLPAAYRAIARRSLHATMVKQKDVAADGGGGGGGGGVLDEIKRRTKDQTDALAVASTKFKKGKKVRNYETAATLTRLLRD